MDAQVKILVVEDDMIIAAKIAGQLTRLGYEVTGIIPRGEDAIRHAEENRPHIALLDIQLKGTLDGIATAHALHDLWHIPVIFVTANSDEATFNRAKATHPYAFIAKPIKNIDLQRAVELTWNLISDRRSEPAENLPPAAGDAPYVLSDRIFIRHKDRMVRIALADILYIEADRNYCHLFTATHQYTLTTPLKVLEDKLPGSQFLRVHRSFIVNLLRIDEVAENHLTAGGRPVAMGNAFREELLKRIKTL